MSPDALAVLSAIANVSTGLGVIAAASQLYLVYKQGITNFEDSFAKEYRKLASELPTKALHGEPCRDPLQTRHTD